MKKNYKAPLLELQSALFGEVLMASGGVYNFGNDNGGFARSIWQGWGEGD